MSRLPPPSSTPSEKALTDRLAQLLSSEEGSRALVVMQQLALATAPRAGAAAPLWPDEPEAIGVWRKRPGGRPDDPVYERCPQLRAEWRLWAEVDRIQRRKQRGKRILLAGESVARGYFYDPHYNPARVLEALVGSLPLLKDTEVVDVARSDVYPERLREIIASALALDPDLLVVFAGNNWCHGKLRHRRDPAVLADVGALLRAGRGFGEVKARLEAAARAEVSDFVTFLGAIARSRCPVIMAVPEFNLVDWEPSTPAPWLADGRNDEWVRARQAARRALATGEGEVDQHACRLMELDGGTSGEGPWLLGRHHWIRGNHEVAQGLLERARDASILDPNPANPRIYGQTQRVLREECPQAGVHLVDLPEVFREHLAGQLPDRRLFHDYSHLTDEGIRVAMAATAAAVARVLTSAEVPWRPLEKAAPRPDPRVAAEAHFMAAIHNAHLGQGYEICHHHAREALRREPALASSMMDYLDAAIRTAPSQLCASFERLCRSSVAMDRYLMAYTTTQFKIVERVLVRAFGDALDRRGSTHRTAITELQVHEQGRWETLDLLRPECHATCHTGRELFDQSWFVAHFRARSEQSTFFLCCERAAAVSLALTLRLPGSAPGRVELWVNEEAVAVLEGQGRWTTRMVTIPAERIRRGANELVIRWPPPSGAFEIEARRLADDIELGAGCDPYPVFGEVQSFTACRAARPVGPVVAPA